MSFYKWIKDAQQQAKAFAKQNQPSPQFKKMVEAMNVEQERYKDLVKGFGDAETVKQLQKVAKQCQAAAERAMKPLNDLQQSHQGDKQFSKRIQQIIAEAGEQIAEARRSKIREFVKKRFLFSLNGMPGVPLEELGKRIEEEITKAIDNALK